MRNRLFAFVLFLISCNVAKAQMVAGSAFLQGKWLEVGVLNNGAFGACNPPPSYHPFGVGANMAQVYDYGHDGWAVGAPPFFGDYTYPGTPFEGWEMQVNGVRSQSFQGGGGTFGCTGMYSGSMAGSITSYVNSGGRIIANWTGNYGGLSIFQETRVDTFASWVVVTARMYNTTGAAIPNVYYLRSSDPDNEETRAFSFTTTNTIIRQNDVDHRVLVNSTGLTYTNCYMGLCTKDCRAKSFWYSSWPISSAADLATVWASGGGVGTSGITLGSTMTNDWGYGLVYNLGTINAGDSTVVSYAYTFNNDNGIDSAFPEPLLVVNGVPANPSGPAPAPTIDTFDVCAHPGMTSMPVDISFADDKCWTWSKWTWSPSTGLSSTTGTHVTITTTVLPATITYTITGTDSAAGMYSCNHRVMYLTIKTCNNVTSNNPCYGDSILMFHHGDSLGATYFWYGPAGFTSTMQNPFIYPAKYPNTGRYYVVQTKLGVSDTDSTFVVVHHKPVLTIVTNSPLCSGMLDTLFMRVTPDSASLISWVGPAGFTSTIVNPQINNFTAINAGTYTVYGVTPFGCKDTESTNVSIVPPPPPPTITGVPAYCFGATFIPPTVTGTGILWYRNAGSTSGTPIKPWLNTPPWIKTDSAATYTLYATQTYGCLSPKDSFKIIVYPRINPNFTFTVTPGCDSDIVMFTNISTNANSYNWNFGDFTADTALGFNTPVRHAYPAPHIIHTVTLTGHNPVCSGDTTLYPDARHQVKALFSPIAPILCLGQTTIMSDSSYSTVGSGLQPLASHEWHFGDGTMDTTNGTPPAHLYNQPGIYPVHLKVTDAISCTDTITKNVVVLKVTIKGLRDTSLCLRNPFQIENQIVLYPDINLTKYGYKWSPVDHLMPGDSSVQEPFFDGFGKITYTFTATDSTYGCADTGHVTINSVLGAKLLNLTADQTITYGSSIQLNADNEVIYWWLPANGSLDNPNINNPVATPTRTTLYTVYGYDINGCLDSAFINITVDSTMNEGVPSAFTPNGDNLNDVFRPVGLKFQHLVEFRIFSRWGQQLFQSNNIKNGWDGTFNGEPQDMGVYYYTITVARPGGDGQNIIYKGEVTLIR